MRKVAENNAVFLRKKILRSNEGNRFSPITYPIISNVTKTTSFVQLDLN